MGGPKGNKHALGCTTSGRPPKYDLVKEAEDLLEWSKSPNAINLFGFVDDKEKEYLAADLYDFGVRDQEFKRALNKAKERIAKNRELKVSKGELHQTAWNRSASLYDKALRKHEQDLVEEKIDYEIKKKTEIDIKQLVVDEVRSAVQDLEKDAGNGEAVRHSVEDVPSILHQGFSGEKGSVQAQLGSKDPSFELPSV